MRRIDTINNLLQEVKAKLIQSRDNVREELVDIDEDGTNVLTKVYTLDRTEVETSIQSIISTLELINQLKLCACDDKR